MLSETMRRVRLEKLKAKMNCPNRRSQPSGCHDGEGAFSAATRVRHDRRRDVVGTQGCIGLRSIKQWSKPPFVSKGYA